MPTISTGNPGWDQNLSTLGNALFPDPSKQAQGYYFGAQARKEQLESNKIVNQQNNQLRLLQMQPDSPQQLAPPTYSQPDLPGAFPVLNPPSNLPMARPGSPQGQPLSSAIVGPSGGAVPQQTMSPAQAAAVTPDQFNNHPANQGQMPPVSPPAPGASPAPNTTGSDGSVPTGDPTAQGFHPGSVTPAGGGVKMSGPAAADGSPARTPVSLATYVATASAAGMDAATAALQGSAYLASLYKQGSIDRDTYHQLLGGTGQPQLGVQDSAAATSIKTTGMTVQGGITQKQMEVAEQARQFNQKPTIIIGPDGVPTFTTQAQAPGKPAFDSPLASVIAGKEHEQVLVDQGPGQPPVPMTAKRAQTLGSPIYQPQTATAEATAKAQAENEVEDYVDLRNPTQLLRRRYSEARDEGLVRAPKTAEGWSSLAASAAVNASPDQAAAIRQKILEFGATAVPKPFDAQEDNRNQTLIDRALDKLFPPPAAAIPGGNTFTNTDPAGAAPNLNYTLKELSDQYYQNGPPGVKGDRIRATNEALQQLVAQKYIDPNQDRTYGMGESGRTRMTKTEYDKAGNPMPNPKAHFRVDIVQPDGPDKGKPYPEGLPPKVKMVKPPALSSTVTTPTPSTARPPAVARPGSLGPAPPNVMEGGTVYDADGKPVGIRRGGQVYPR